VKIKKTKLNLGSGKDYKKGKGWLNIDINPDFKPDIVADLREITFEKNSFTNVYAKDIINQFTLLEVRKLIRKIFKWLKPNGLLTIHTPNLRFLANRLARDDDELALKWMYGSEGEGSTEYWSNQIRWCYSKKALGLILEAVGFTVLHFETMCSGFSFMVIAVKKE